MDIVPTFGATPAQAAVGWWTCTGLTSDTPFDFASGTSDPQILDCDVQAGGFIVAAGGCFNNTGYTTTGLTNERWDEVVEATRTWTGADDPNISAATPQSISMNLPGSTSAVAIAASF